MLTFQYEAIHPDGYSLKGRLEADSLLSARKQLRSLGYLPTELKEYKKRSFSFQTVNKQDLALLTRQLATLLAAGIPIEEALLGVSEQTEKPKVKEILTGVRNKVLEGFSLAQALDEFNSFFPELYRTTVGAGEQSGRLDKILEDLADYTEKQQAMKQKVQHALTYPVIMMVVSFSIITFLLAFVVPTMIQVFTDSGQTLPIMTRILIDFSHFVQYYGLYVFAVFLLLALLARRLLKDPKRHYRFHVFLLQLPVVAYFIKTVNVTRYIHTFSMLFAAGVNVLETMKISSQLVQNRPMRAAFQEAAHQVREGRDISSALKDTRYIQPMALHLIASGEKSGSLAIMMKHAANHLEQEVSRLIETGLSLLEPMMILIMGGVVLFIVLATLLPIFSMEQLVG
ncbi:MAG: type II secretion system inner membrane protein GspF [Gammaproteobacteria bacterium]|nr:type II secretion system inner membrane protein GspF [Gammaproteobacteria bacterium]